MPVTIVTDLLWGDSGKGSVADYEAEKAEMVVRYDGGNNAGHTMWVNGNKFVTHNLPCGIIRRGMKNCTGPYVVHSLDAVKEELEIADSCGSDVFMDFRAPLIMPFQIQIDQLREKALGKNAIGTTGRGIGPCYEDFTSRRSILLGDLRDMKLVIDKLVNGRYFEEKCAVIEKLGGQPIPIDELLAWCESAAKIFVPRLADTGKMVRDLLCQNCLVIGEGAQGMLLNLLVGQYPYVTSSLCGPQIFTLSFGVNKFERVIGVLKAFSTRVGNGPLPTEMEENLANLIREKGDEFGASTGRPRRIGWLDLIAADYAMRRTGATEVVITKLDVLSCLPELKVCVDYDTEDETLPAIDELSYALLFHDKSDNKTLSTEKMRQARPTYKVLRGWEKSLDDVIFNTEATMHDLESNNLFCLIDYIKFIGIYLQKKIPYVRIGTDRFNVCLLE